MIYIRKRKTPNIIAKEATAIKKDPASGYEKLELPKDSIQLRFLFEQMPKATIRSELIKEQHGLCAYCMKEIKGQQNDTKIEHYKALSMDKEGALDYQNYLGVCYGGEHNSPDQNKQSVQILQLLHEVPGVCSSLHPHRIPSNCCNDDYLLYSFLNIQR